jgi:hypothetical protein
MELSEKLGEVGLLLQATSTTSANEHSAKAGFVKKLEFMKPPVVCGV